MGFLRHLPAGIFIAVALSVGVFAIAVNANHTVLETYEKRVKPPLEFLEFLFTLIGLLYFVLPMLSFAVVTDWTKTFFDCFSPITLWMDVIFCSVLIINFIAFLGGMKDNVGRILTEYGGMGLLLSCIYIFVMLKASNDTNFNRDQATVQIWISYFGTAAVSVCCPRRLYSSPLLPCYSWNCFSRNTTRSLCVVSCCPRR